jgi:hypothetical protein
MQTMQSLVSENPRGSLHPTIQLFIRKFPHERAIFMQIKLIPLAPYTGRDGVNYPDKIISICLKHDLPFIDLAGVMSCNRYEPKFRCISYTGGNSIPDNYVFSRTVVLHYYHFRTS